MPRKIALSAQRGSTIDTLPSWLLVIHAVVWTVGAWLANSNLDRQGDMVENYVWGIEWQAGYAKHPPLFAWITAAWFRFLPHLDIVYFALSALNVLVGLAGIAALAGRFLQNETSANGEPWSGAGPRSLAIVAALTMAVSPLYSTLAVKFNANAVLLSVWPWAAYWFVRYMQTGRATAALVLGVLAALAVLGKYFSVVLLIALLVSALARPAWRRQLLNWRSLLVVVAGLVALAPHINWLVQNHFPTLGYASERTGGSLGAALGRYANYTAAQFLYVLPSLGFVVLLVVSQRWRATRLMLRSYVKPSLAPDLWWLTLTPLFAVGLIALAAKTEMASVWGMAEWFALVPLWLVVLSRANIELKPRRAPMVMAVYWLLVLAISAYMGWHDAARNKSAAAEPHAELAYTAHQIWRDKVGGPLSIVTGSSREAMSVAFYSKGETQYWEYDRPAMTPWLTRDDLLHRGAMFVCRNDDAACIKAAASFDQPQAIALTVGKEAWGMKLPSWHYKLFVIPPQR